MIPLLAGAGLIKKLLVPLLSLLVFLAVAGLAVSSIPGFSIPFFGNISLTSRTSETHSQILLTHVRPLFKLSTVEYTYKTVFPYDFFPENTDYKELHTIDYYNMDIPPEMVEEMELYRLCKDIGIEVGTGSYDFVVITTDVKAGYNLKGSLWEDSSDGSQRLEAKASPQEAIHVEDSSDKQIVTVSLPKAEITEFVIQDETSAHYKYPDIEITASGWRRVSEYVSDRIRRRVIEDGILDKAEERTKELIGKLLSEAKNKELIFKTPR